MKEFLSAKSLASLIDFLTPWASASAVAMALAWAAEWSVANFSWAATAALTASSDSALAA